VEVQYPFRNLVFEGGGVKGIAYVGALEELQKRNIVDRIIRVGGTSAGAINAVLLSLGFSLNDMRQIMSSLDFRNFKDASNGIIPNLLRLLNKFGWCDLHPENWAKDNVKIDRDSRLRGGRLACERRGSRRLRSSTL